MKVFGTIILAVFLFVNMAVCAASKALAGLPPVTEVHSEALRHARYDVAEVASWRRKARRAAFVPKVQLEFGKRLRNNINIGIQDNVYVGSGGIVVGPEEGDYKNARSDDLTIGMRAIWELGNAVFSTKSIAASAEARRAVRDRNLLLAAVNKHYYNVAGFPEEARIMREIPAASKKPKFVELKIFQRRISCKESAAQLDALTGGWFGRSVVDERDLCAEVRTSIKGG